MDRQFCREKRGKNSHISGRITHCVLLQFREGLLSNLSNEDISCFHSDLIYEARKKKVDENSEYKVRWMMRLAAINSRWYTHPSSLVCLHTSRINNAVAEEAEAMASQARKIKASAAQSTTSPKYPLWPSIFRHYLIIATQKSGTKTPTVV